MEHDGGMFKIDYETAEAITVDMLKYHISMLVTELDEIANETWNDTTAKDTREYKDKLVEVLKYFLTEREVVEFLFSIE